MKNENIKNELIKILEKLESDDFKNWISNDEALLQIKEICYNYNIENYMLDDFISYETLEIIAKNELENGGLERLYYFLPSEKSGNPYAHNEFFKINGYGNAEVVEKNDIILLVDEIFEYLED